MLIERGRLRPFDGTITGADPFAVIENGALVTDDGEVVDCGTATAMIEAYPDAAIVDSSDLLTPGLTDSHIHYSQTRIVGTFGGGLLEWLESVTFPQEQKFEDPAYAREIAKEFFDTLEGVGTTAATVYCTSNPVSVDALFEEALTRNIRVSAGLVMMDRNAPSPLLTPAQEAYDQSRALIEKWHGADNGRLTYTITPRFAPTSTPALLEAAAALWDEFPSCGMQTHLSENTAEVEWVRRLFPKAPDYLGVYEMFGLVGPGAIFAHAIHLTDREVGLLAESGSVVAHCPTANRFLASGRCDVARLLKAGVRVKLGSDIGAGTTFDMMEVAEEAEGVPKRGRPPAGALS
ncbi:Guanine deaminase [Stappia sp. 22II-S9-Z10]|nr:Guanine deaminase [Stappia sp. 22II-S9-Z10]